MNWLFSKKKHTGDRGESIPEPHDGLPDSNHPSGLCPRCGKQSSFENLGSLPVTFEDSYVVEPSGKRIPLFLDRVTSLLCRHCHHAVVVIEEKWIGDHPAREGIKQGGTNFFKGIYWWPLPDTQLPDEIPSEIAGVFAEATTVLHANCPRAAAVMARRTLEAITVDKKETKGSLAQRLNSLNARGILHPTLADWAKEIRLVGNVGAHFDPIQQVSHEDALQLITFIRELLRYLYELPAELDKRRSQQSQE